MNTTKRCRNHRRIHHETMILVLSNGTVLTGASQAGAPLAE